MTSLAKGERVLAEATSSDGEQSLIATQVALHLDGRVIRWDQILSAKWDEPHLMISVQIDPSHAAEHIMVSLENARRFLEVVRDRVTASVVMTERRSLPIGAVATFTARKRSDTGEMVWSVIFDGNPDLSDPELIEQAEHVLADLRGSLGI
jgi:hypothetical protein